MKKGFLYFYLMCIISFATYGQNKINDELIVKYAGEDKTANTDYHDGQMRPAVGTQNYQILRANRSYPELADGLGWTYNHAPMLAYWNGYFICQYLSNPMGEHWAPGVTLITKSENGILWEKPRIVFPVYTTIDNTEGKMMAINEIMHQRMGFHVAPNGRLLVMGFYGGNEGDGVGRVVREIYEDFSMGPVYFIRVNDNWKGELKYPVYQESADKQFIEACESFISDRIRRIQWWEEDREASDADEFYMPYDTEKAFAFYTVSDTLTIGLFKGRMMTYTKDGGVTWKKPFETENLTYDGAKIWGQKLDNGQYAVVYNPTDNSNRHPLSVAISDDGINFDKLSVVHGEVPVKRYWGWEKRPGPQYVRGIVEGNGNPSGDDLWVVYSVSKEDIWISRIPVPIERTVDGPVNDDFNSMETGGVVKNWNIYSPVWCPVRIVDFPNKRNKSLMLKDSDPYDYARATRVFGQASRQRLSFDLYVMANPGSFFIDICDEKGTRLIQTVINSEGIVNANNGSGKLEKVKNISSGKWMTFTFDISSDEAKYDLFIDGDIYSRGHKFSGAGNAERILFRTGDYRLTEKIQEYKSGDKFTPGFDEPNADKPIDEALFYIRSFRSK